MKQVMNYNKDNGLLNMIRRTDPMINFMKNVASTNGVITIQFHNPGHADNVRALKVFNRMPQMNTLIFRQKLYNVNQMNFHTQNTPLKILWIK